MTESDGFWSIHIATIFVKRSREDGTYPTKLNGRKVVRNLYKRVKTAPISPMAFEPLWVHLRTSTKHSNEKRYKVSLYFVDILFRLSPVSLRSSHFFKASSAFKRRLLSFSSSPKKKIKGENCISES